jgi:hypothetical protein
MSRIELKTELQRGNVWRLFVRYVADPKLHNASPNLHAVSVTPPFARPSPISGLTNNRFMSHETSPLAAAGNASRRPSYRSFPSHTGAISTPPTPETCPGPTPVSLVLENSGSVARDHLASERTFLAYVRTSLTMASAGVGGLQPCVASP